MAAGVMLMLFRPFHVGDTVVIAGQLGTVDEIELFTTRLDTPDMRRVIIPNGQVFGSIIQNITQHPIRRVDATLSVSHAADIDHTRRVLTEAARQVPGVISERPIEVLLTTITPGTVDWTVILWTKAADAGPAKQALLKRIKETLDHEDIAQPLPQMVLHAGPGMGAAPNLGATAR
jgi:small conductance mechanosensitive channel